MTVINTLLALPPTFWAAVGALIVGLRNGQKANAIHVLVNSNLDSVKKETADLRAELKKAVAEIAVLHQLLEKHL